MRDLNEDQIVKTNDVVVNHVDDENAQPIEVNKHRSVVVDVVVVLVVIGNESVVLVRNFIYVVQDHIDSSTSKKVEVKDVLYVATQLIMVVEVDSDEIEMLTSVHYFKMVPVARGIINVDHVLSD